MSTNQDALNALDDYQSGAMSDAEADAFEAELFDGKLAGEALFLDTFVRLSQHLAARTTFNIGHTRAEVDALRAKYDCVFVDCDAAATHHASVRRGADYYITRIALDLAGIERLEVENFVAGHGYVKTMRDIRFEASENAVYGVCEEALWSLSMAHGNPIVSKFYGYEGETRRLIGENTVTVVYADP